MFVVKIPAKSLFSSKIRAFWGTNRAQHTNRAFFSLIIVKFGASLVHLFLKLLTIRAFFLNKLTNNFTKLEQKLTLKSKT